MDEDKPDFSYATEEPRLKPSPMPAGEGTRFWEEEES